MANRKRSLQNNDRREEKSHSGTVSGVWYSVR